MTGVTEDDVPTRPGTVTLRLADAGARPVVERLAQLERHDMSQWAGFLPGSDGVFDVPRLERFFEDADHDAYLIYTGNTLAGFCLVRPFQGGSSFIHAFFVVRALRGSGVGLAAAVALLRSRGGRWAIAFVEENDVAARFWRKVASQVAGESWSERRETAPHGGQTFTFVEVDMDRDGRPRR